MKLRHLWLAAATAAVVSLLSAPFIGRASQNNLSLATTGVFSGLTEQNNINNALDSLLTCNSGSVAPTNQLGGAPKEGQCWLDTTSTTLKVLKRYTGAAWVVEAVLDVTNGIWSPPVGGGLGSVASAGTTDLCASPQAFQTISGTTTITSFGSSCAAGVIKYLKFSGALTLTYNASSLILPEAQNITTVAGDTAIAAYLGSGNWQVMRYTLVTTPSKASPTSSDFIMIQDAAASNAPKKSLVSSLLALVGVTGIDSQVGAFTTGNGVDSVSKVIELTSARRTLPTLSVVSRSAHSGGFSANASGTYTSPANCLWVRARAVGAGGGGGGGGPGGGGGAGGNTTFSTLTASGGTGGNPGGTTSGPVAGGAATGGDINIVGSTSLGGSGSNTSGGSIGGGGGPGYFGGAAGGGSSSSGSGSAAAVGSGSGGGGGGASANNPGQGGGAGGYVEKIFTCPVSAVSFSVGTAGTAGGGSGGGAGGLGGEGQIIVDEHYGS